MCRYVQQQHGTHPSFPKKIVQETHHQSPLSLAHHLPLM